MRLRDGSDNMPRMRRPSLSRSLPAVVALALVAGGGSAVGAGSSGSPAPPDPCAVTSAEAVPAACASKTGAVDRGGDGADVAIAAGNAFADGQFFSPGFEADKLTFPPGNMATPQQVADEAATTGFFGYDFSADGSVLYGIDDVTSTLFTVNQATGAQTTVGPMTKPAGHTWVDLSINPVTNAAYAVSDTGAELKLQSVNLGTGATTPIATVANAAVLIDMSINCAGEAYATTLATDSLVKVNLATGVPTSVGPLGVDLNFAQGIDFDNASGVLHGWLLKSGLTSQYSSLNLTTGAATAFPGGGPQGEFEGAIKTLCPAPTASVTTGPSGHTADLRPTFGFTTTTAASVQCSVDKGAATFVACPGATYQPGANLAPGDYTFRVKANGAAGQTANATRAFTVVDCATLKSNLAKASAKLKKAKKTLKKAKQSGNAAKIKKAAKKVKKAKKAKKAAKAALAAEPVCG
jgi:uncharacterized protein DUF4394